MLVVTENRSQPPAGRLTDVRIIEVPAIPVAAAHARGPEPESAAWAQLIAFADATDLLGRMPDARVFGFNHPNPPTGGGEYGYEVWVTIPGDLDVLPPLTRKELRGGTYAAHTIAMGDFHEWGWLERWVMTSDTWEYAGGPEDGPHNMFGSFEESPDVLASLAGSDPTQLDLLIPVRRKTR